MNTGSKVKPIVDKYNALEALYEEMESEKNEYEENVSGLHEKRDLHIDHVSSLMATGFLDFVYELARTRIACKALMENYQEPEKPRDSKLVKNVDAVKELQDGLQKIYNTLTEIYEPLLKAVTDHYDLVEEWSLEKKEAKEEVINESSSEEQANQDDKKTSSERVKKKEERHTEKKPHHNKSKTTENEREKGRKRAN